jgi:putative membrane protein
MSNSTQVAPKKDPVFLWLIGILSILIPVVVAILLFMPQTGKLGDLDVSFLPHLNAILNSATAVALLTGYYFVKRKQIAYHRTAMVTAFALSSLFLVAYVVYHFQAPSTKFGDINHNQIVEDTEKAAVGFIRYIYYVLLLTHIVLAAVVVFFALMSLYLGFTKQYDRHRKISRWTFPIWTYVAITGVIVYLMISPYYR